MKTKLLLPALLVATLTSSPVFAEVREGAFTASIFEGGYTFDGNQHLQTNLASGVRLGYNFNKNWGAEGQFTYVPLKSTLSVPNEGDQYSFSGNLLYHFLPTNRLVPFLAMGGGWSRTTNNYYYNDNDDYTFNYGAGLKYFLTDSVALRGDLRNVLSFHTAKYGAGNYWSNYEYTVGLAFQFGGTKAAPPDAPAAKPVTAAKAPEPAQAQRPAQEQMQSESVIPAPSLAPFAESVPPAALAQEAAPVKAQPPETAAPVQLQLAGAGKCNSCRANSVSSVEIRPNGIEIISGVAVENYRIFKLSAPARLVIDICCATYDSDVKALKLFVERMGVSTVRIGTHPGKLRVVIDSPLAGFPDYRIDKSERGISVTLPNN